MRIHEVSAFVAAAQTQALMFALKGDAAPEAFDARIGELIEDVAPRFRQLFGRSEISAALRAAADDLLVPDPNCPANSFNPLIALNREFLLRVAAALERMPPN